MISGSGIRIWKASVRTPRGGRQPRGHPTSAETIDGLAQELADIVRQLAERDFLELWDALSDRGRELFTGNVIEAASRPPEDRVRAISDVIEAWRDEWQLMVSAPLDDEPFKAEERREVEEAEEQLNRAEAVPLRRLR